MTLSGVLEPQPKNKTGLVFLCQFYFWKSTIPGGGVISPFVRLILSIDSRLFFGKSILGWFVLRLYDIIVIILALIVIIFPVETTVFLIILMGMVLLIDGISRLVHEFGDKECHGWSRGFRIGLGIQMIVAGIPGRRVGILL